MATVALTGMRQLQAALKDADRDTRLGVKKKLAETAEPVRRDAEDLAISKIRNMSLSPRWSGMRTGVTRTSVYVAPRQRGIKGASPAKRRNLAPLLMGRAMEPALDRSSGNVERDLEQALDWMADRFNRGGLVI
jgi:hypothetical protein